MWTTADGEELLWALLMLTQPREEAVPGVRDGGREMRSGVSALHSMAGDQLESCLHLPPRLLQQLMQVPC